MGLRPQADGSPAIDRQWLWALAVSLIFGLELQYSLRLGFYSDDFIKAANVLLGGPEASGFWRRAAFRVLSDEPLFNLYHNLRFLLFGADASWPHHVLEGSLHVLNGVLVFQLVRRLTGELAQAWATLLLFAAFPGLGQAQFWPAASYAPILTLLLAALLGWISWLKTGSRASLLSAFAFYAAAIFMHETAFFFWGVFAAIFAWQAASPFDDSRKSKLAWLACINLAYLAIRQTDWFGFGQFSHVADRPLSLAAVPELAFAGVNLNFGPWLWLRVASMLRDASGLDLVRAAAAGLAGASIPALLLRPPGLSRTATLSWFLGAAALVAGCGWALGAALAQRVFTAALFLIGGWALARRGPLKLALFGAVWFFLAFAPTYLYYIAFRHSYAPAVGAAIGIAALFVALGRLPGRPAAAVSWGLLGTVVAFWHLACLGEKNQWISWADELRDVQALVQAIEPPPGPDSVLVLQGVKAIRHGNPVFDEPAVSRAVPLWLNQPGLRATRGFIPEESGFRVRRNEPLIPYERLRLLRYADGALEEIRSVELPSGRLLRLPAASGAGGS